MNNNLSCSSRLWQAGLVVLLLVFLIAMVFSMTTAKRKVSRVVDKDYYSHGLAYGKESAASRSAAEHGWRTSALTQGDILEIKLSDSSSANVGGASMRVEGIVKTGAGNGDGRQFSALAKEESPGVYRVQIPGGTGSELRATVSVSRGADRYSEKLLVIR